MRDAFRCILAVTASLAIGIFLHHPLAGMVMASGAMSVGFGSFQRLYRSRVYPMLLACLGMGLSTFVGTLSRHFSIAQVIPGLVLIGGFWAWGCGLLAALSPGALWIGQQSVVALLVAAAYPVSFQDATRRAELIVAGGFLQISLIALQWMLDPSPKPSLAADTEISPTGLAAFKHLWRNMTLKQATGRYAFRLGMTILLTISIHRLWGLRNGYWIPMTALFVLKPDFQQTLSRAFSRVIGTCLSAGVTTLLVVLFRPQHMTLAIFVVIFAWLAYALQKVNYALYSICITSYIVFLLSFAGLPGKTVVYYRVLNTALGGAIALLAYVSLLLPFRRRSETL